ncbi:hypothetical protein AE26_05503, partial [Klebsiella pneumoniae UCI 67]
MAEFSGVPAYPPVLDAMLAVIIRDARKIGQKKRLRSLKDLDKS